jgi:hypothetical protein
MALAEIRDEAAITAITGALKDEDASVRRAAAMALAELSGSDWHDGPRVSPNPRPTPTPTPTPTPNPNPRSNPNPRPNLGGAK